jgi:hypothetical protein
MTDSNVEAIFQLYDTSPSLVLFESVSNEEYSKESEVVSSVCKLSERKLNPIEIVMESLINVFSEEISSKEITLTKESVLVNSRVRSLAVEKIIALINNDNSILKMLHDMWLDKLRSYLTQLYNERNHLTIDAVIFRVSNQFRISSLSAIKAIKSI